MKAESLLISNNSKINSINHKLTLNNHEDLFMPSTNNEFYSKTTTNKSKNKKYKFNYN